jgi:hypothetical protein
MLEKAVGSPKKGITPDQSARMPVGKAQFSTGMTVEVAPLLRV